MAPALKGYQQRVGQLSWHCNSITQPFWSLDDGGLRAVGIPLRIRDRFVRERIIWTCRPHLMESIDDFSSLYDRKPSTAQLNRIKKTVLTLLEPELKQRIYDECHTCPECGNFSEQSLIAVEMCDACAPSFRKCSNSPQHQGDSTNGLG